MTPTFTVLVGSAGRDTLDQTLQSFSRQRRVQGDQMIVSFDAFERDADWLHGQFNRVRLAGLDCHACAYDSGYHWLGVEQINHALRNMPITGTHVFTLGDDDVFVDGAFSILRDACAVDLLRPVLYRFVAPWRELLWDQPRMQMSKISGCCIAAPVGAVGPMPTRQYVEHDYDWMLDILAKSPAPLWLDQTLVIARPPMRGTDVAHRGVLQCWHCKGWRYYEDVDITKPKCPNCGVVTDLPGHRYVGSATAGVKGKNDAQLAT